VLFLPAAISVGLGKWVKEKVKEKEGNDNDAAGDSKVTLWNILVESGPAPAARQIVLGPILIRGAVL
jgi:hypothetical protein